MDLRKLWIKKFENLKAARQEFETGKLNLETLPSKGIIELTQNCNFKCTMCPQSFEERFRKYRPDYNMPNPLFQKIAEEFFPLATFIDLRGFGETTILPEWPEIVDYLTKFPLINWHLVTNLSLPRDDTWQKMMKLGFTLGASIDAGSKNIFEAIRSRSRFSQIEHNLEVIRSARKDSDSGGIYFISTIQKANVQEMRSIVELAHKFNVPEVQIKIVQSDHKKELLEVPADLIQQSTEQAIDAAIDLGVRLTFNDHFFLKNIDQLKIDRCLTQKAIEPIPKELSEIFRKDLHLQSDYRKFSNEFLLPSYQVSRKQKCFKPYSLTYINYLGQVGTCNHMMYPQTLVMGDLNTQSLMEIWNGEKYQKFRNELITVNPTDSRCKWCFAHRLED